MLNKQELAKIALEIKSIKAQLLDTKSKKEMVAEAFLAEIKSSKRYRLDKSNSKPNSLMFQITTTHGAPDEPGYDDEDYDQTDYDIEFDQWLTEVQLDFEELLKFFVREFSFEVSVDYLKVDEDDYRQSAEIEVELEVS